MGLWTGDIDEERLLVRWLVAEAVGKGRGRRSGDYVMTYGTCISGVLVLKTQSDRLGRGMTVRVRDDGD